MLIKCQLHTTLVVDKDGHDHQEHVWVPTQSRMEMLREFYARQGLQLLGTDALPGKCSEINLNLNALLTTERTAKYDKNSTR